MLYGLLSLRGYYPHIEYRMHREYIAKELCVNRFRPQTKCNGKCHLKKQIALLDENPLPTTPTKGADKKTNPSTKDWAWECVVASLGAPELRPELWHRSLRYLLLYAYNYCTLVFVPPPIPYSDFIS